MADFKDRRKDMNARASSLAPPVDDNPISPLVARELVRTALNNPTYFWRTAEGIAEETHLQVEAVDHYLKTLSESLIVSAVPDPGGRTRYTTLEHYRAHAGILRRVLDTLSDQVR